VARRPRAVAAGRGLASDHARGASGARDRRRRARAGLRDRAAESFPGDAWSQSDDFHAHEARQIRELAHQRHVTVEEVLRAIDDDLHAPERARRSDHGSRGVTAVPCKPRPFYD
jgi:hypothetical protein